MYELVIVVTILFSMILIYSQYWS